MLNEIAKYDWTPERWVTVIRGKQSFKKFIPYGRFSSLIYKGRTPDAVDPGTRYSKELLKGLLAKNKLTGQALEDARSL